MQIYHYHPLTGLLLFSSAADADPLEPGRFLLPACATSVAPFEPSAGNAICFNEELGDWQAVPDHRGQVYFDTATGQRIVIYQVNQEPEPTWTELAPTDPECQWLTDHWELPLTTLAERQRTAIRTAFAEAALAPVVDGNRAWNGGYESALKLDAAHRMAERLGVASVTFYDLDNQGHVLSMAEASAVVVAVAGAYQQHYTRKQALFGQIEAALAAADRAALAAITW